MLIILLICIFYGFVLVIVFQNSLHVVSLIDTLN